MLKKIDQACGFLKEHTSTFLCPICQCSFTLQGYSLICKNKHQFDLSKKGTLYFLSHGVQTDYNQKMLLHRREMIQHQMYQPVLEQIIALVEDDSHVLDVGCGEGSFLQQLSMLGLNGMKIGMDISKDGIYLASNHDCSAFWCVADLTNLPFERQSMTTLLNIFSPSHYQEFQRVLTQEGTLIKVVPEKNYLKELRQLFYPNDVNKQQYSNQKVVEKFSQEMEIVANERISYSFPVNIEKYEDLLAMSPLEWGVDEEIKINLIKKTLSAITIDVRILKGKKKTFTLS